MSTTIRPELSEKNQYWIDKHRYYELKHLCIWDRPCSRRCKNLWRCQYLVWHNHHRVCSS